MQDEASLFRDASGPVERFSWAAYLIRGEEHSSSKGAGKDIRLIGTEVTPWEERHGHRLKKSMITGVYDSGIEVLIIGIGVEGAIEVPDKVRRAVAERGIPELIVERTPQACRAYNALYREGKRVALLAHGTC